MRYRFEGRRPDTGEPVRGRVTAPSEEAARRKLRDSGIVPDAMVEEPAAPDASAAARAQQLARALDDALDDAGMRVSFDRLSGRYRGKSVWVLDREKIRRHVAKLVDDAIVASLRDGEARQEARRRIAQLLEQMFQDTRNVASERSAPAPSLEERMNRLAEAVARIDRAVASMRVKGAAPEGGAARRAAPEGGARDRARDEILIEVFESNRELMKGLGGEIR